MPRLSEKKNNNHGFRPGSAHACFLRTRWSFRVPFLTLPFGLGIIVEHPWFISCYYFMQNFGSISNLPRKYWQISNRFAFCSTDKFYGTNFAQMFRMCKCSVRIPWPAFLFKPVSSAIILTLNRRSFVITPRTTSTFWSFFWRDWPSRTGVVSKFFGPLWKLFAT